MIHSRLIWNGEHVFRQTLDAGWENIARAATYFWARIQDALNVPNTGISAKTGGSGKGKTERVYPNPSKPGEPPHKVSGFLASNVEKVFFKDKLAARVGIFKNAWYGIVLELGHHGGKIIRPKAGKFLRFWSRTKNKWVFARQIIQGELKARPWLLATLEKYWDQIKAQAGGA